MAMDYDLWWKLYKQAGPLQFVDAYVAVNREHSSTKTNTQRRMHYQEAMAVVRKYHGSVLSSGGSLGRMPCGGVPYGDGRSAVTRAVRASKPDL